MPNITLVVRRRGGRILDVRTCWSHWTINCKCSYWLNSARCAAHPTVVLFLVHTVPPIPTSFFLVGIPANPKRDHHWVKRKSTKSVFCQHIFSSMPRFFSHHQVDQAQRDGKKMLLAMITAVSRILSLDFDFPENYTHINQVVLLLLLPTWWLQSWLITCSVIALFSLKFEAYESNEMV